MTAKITFLPLFSSIPLIILLRFCVDYTKSGITPTSGDAYGADAVIVKVTNLFEGDVKQGL